MKNPHWPSTVACPLVLALAMIWLQPREASAALRKISFESMVAKSRYVVVGQVVSLQSRWDNFADTGRVLLTDVRVRVDEVWKDSQDARKDIVRGTEKTKDGSKGTIRELSVQYLGGQIGERWQRCPESPKYQIGERVVLFVRVIDGRLWTTGWLQGKYRWYRDTVVSRGGEPERIYETVLGHSQLPISKNVALSTLRERVRKTIALQKLSAEQELDRTTTTGTEETPDTSPQLEGSSEGGER